MSVSLINTNTLMKLHEKVLAAGCDTAYDRKAGTFVAFDKDENVVMRAIQKGEGQPWIATFFDSELVTWHSEKPPAIKEAE